MSGLVEASSARDAATVTKSDSTIVNCDAVYVGGTGNVAVLTAKGTTITFPSVPAGALLPIKCQKIMSTNTTATDMVALFY